MRMKGLPLILALLGTLGLVGCGQVAIFHGTTVIGNGWVIVNSASDSGSITNLTIPPTGRGNLIAVALMFNGATSVTSVSDDAGNSYVSAGARSVSGSASTEIWYAANSNSGATLITPTFADATTHVEITSWEVNGISTSPLDVANTSTGTMTSDNVPGPAVTTTHSGDFVVSIMFAIDTGLKGISSGNEFTDDFTTDGNGWAHITSDKAPAGSHQASWYTATPQGPYCASTAAFLAATH